MLPRAAPRPRAGACTLESSLRCLRTPRIIEFSRGVLEIRENSNPSDDAGPALQVPASAYPEARMLPRAAPRPRAGACTLESSLRCLRTSDHRVLRGVLEIRENRPPPDDAGPALQEPASAYPEARMLPRAAPRPRAGACTLESSLRCLRTSDHTVVRGVLEIRENRPPPTMLERRFKSRHLLAQRRACCPGLPRGSEQAPAPWSPPSAACAPPIIELSRGVLKIPENGPSPRRCWTGASRAGICLPRGAHAAPGCPEAPSRRLHPGVLPPLPAHLRSSISSVRLLKNHKKSTSPRRCWTGASRAGICLPRGAHAAPGCPEAPSRRLHPGVLPPLPAHPSDHRVLPWGVGNSRKFKSLRRCWTGASRAGICLPRGAHAAPGCPEAPSRRLHPGVLPPLPAHLGSSSSPGGVGNSRQWTSSRRCWTGASRAGICLPRGAHAAPGCPEAPSRRLHPGVLPPLPAHLRSYGCPGGVGDLRKSTSPDDAGPALQEPASACPEARMLPRAAPRPRAGACTLESSLRCLRTSDHQVLRGVLEIRENGPPPDDAGPALQEPASAYPEARMLPRAAPRPRAGACTLESSLRCLRTSDHRALRGVLEIRENRPPPDDAGPALQEPASAYPEARMLPRAAPRPRAGACTLESSLRCLRTSDHRVLPWTGCWKFEKIDLPPTMLDRRFKSRHLLTQRRACCPGLPRGPEQAPAPWSPPAAECGRCANQKSSASSPC
jgi:hypothetical protein